MMKKKYSLKTTAPLLLLVVVLIILEGCKTINTHVSIPTKELPASYNTNSDSTTIANINWRSYFADDYLSALLDSALTANQDLQIALQRIEAARANHLQAVGALAPQILANTSAAIRRYGLYTMDGAGNISTEMLPGKIVPINLPDLYLGIQASWEIDLWGKLRSNKKAAVANILSNIEGVNLIISNLIADISIAYYSLIALDNELAIIRQFKEKQQEALEVIKLKKESGRGNLLAVQQFESQVLGSDAMAIEIQQKIIETENLINFLIGRYPQPILRSQQVLSNEIPPAIAHGIPSQLLSHRPDIREAELQIVSTKFDLNAAKLAFYPNLVLTGSLGYQAFNPQFLFNTPASIAYSALGNLTAPLINRKAIKARFNTAKSNQLTAMYQYQKTILNAYREVVNELSNINLLQEMSNIAQQQSLILTQSVETATELYNTAKANYLEVLISQQNALQAQLSLIEINKRQRIATINIYKALGGGWR